MGIVLIVAGIVILGAGLTAFVLWWLKAQFTEIARTVFKRTGEDFLKIARGQLDLEHHKGVSELELRRQAIQTTVEGLEKQLEKYEQLVRQFEKDRGEKYGQLTTELKRAVDETTHLKQTTNNLVAVLGNSRVRGQWGQKMAEDILRLCGLHEGIQYQREQGILEGRPDYTFQLPDGHSLFMDVKFPLDHYLKFTNAESEDDQRRCKEAFIRSVRDHLREMERRAYGTSDQAVDYILIFIPNEQVYGCVNEWIPQLIDECLQKKMILCGPWTLYAIVRIIQQAWQNYQFSLTIRDIVKTINGFLQDYVKFKGRFDELGELLKKLEIKYDEIAVTSAQRLESKIRRIEEYRKGSNIPEALPETNDSTAQALTPPELLELNRRSE